MDVVTHIGKSFINPMTPFFLGVWNFVQNYPLNLVILKRMNLEICEHSSFSIIDDSKDNFVNNLKNSNARRYRNAYALK